METLLVILLAIIAVASLGISGSLRRIAEVNEAWWKANSTTTTTTDDASTTTTDEYEVGGTTRPL